MTLFWKRFFYLRKYKTLQKNNKQKLLKMSSVSTETEFTSSLKKDENLYLTKDRQYLYFNDLQGGNYNNNSSEVRFELISLANTNQFVSWCESFVLIPLLLSVSGYIAAG